LLPPVWACPIALTAALVWVRVCGGLCGGGGGVCASSVCVSVGSLPSLPSDWVCDGSPDPTRLAGVLIFYYYFFLPTAVNNGFFLFFFGTGVSPFGTEVGGGGGGPHRPPKVKIRTRPSVLSWYSRWHRGYDGSKYVFIYIVRYYSNTHMSDSILIHDYILCI
jgi:hypothetical protein